MRFEPLPHVPKLSFDPPDTIPIHEFLFDNTGKYGRPANPSRKAPFTCGYTGRSFSAVTVTERVEHLACALSKELGWQVNEGKELDKVIGIFAINNIDYMTVAWAAHRLSGVACPINPGYSLHELANQLSSASCKALFTSAPLTKTALEAAKMAGIPEDHIFSIEVPPKYTEGVESPVSLKSVDQLIDEGIALAPLPPIEWSKGQGARQTAFLCSSSGTSGLPKLIKMSHHNVISNISSWATYEGMYGDHDEPEIGLGLLPQSHGYALNLICQASIYRGDGVIIQNGFDLQDTLDAIQKFQIKRLWLVPSIIVAITKAPNIVKKYDLSSVQSVVVGASPIPAEMLAMFTNMIPGCRMAQAYGLTEASVMISLTNRDDDVYGSCGHLIPGWQARIVDQHGVEVTEYNSRGELVVSSPSVMLGYLNNDDATKETITEDGWLRTGDLVEIRKSARGIDHLFVVDRIKELIKVRGMQVAPAELEKYILQHPMVADVAVVPVPSDSAGELPRAYVVKSKAFAHGAEKVLREQLRAYVNEQFASYKRLDGGIEFVDSLPKTASGKTKRGTLKQMARASVEVAALVAAIQAKTRIMVEVFEFGSDDEDN